MSETLQPPKARPRSQGRSSPSSRIQKARAAVRGKFIFVGGEKLYIRGVTYGTFRPNVDQVQFPDRRTVDQDFRVMARTGINAVRTYTPPPFWLLDLAAEHGLYVMAGLPWEQHVAFLDEPGRAEDIERRVRQSAIECSAHPAVLCLVIGNEIPASMVRWHGARRTEQFIRKLYDAVKAVATDLLVTYVNFPTTEYLSLPFLDLVCFNVFLEEKAALEAYLAHVQNLAGDRPLIMTEIGLDSRRNGDVRQAEVLDWQIRTVFAAGCAGMFVFAWTDEWYRGGFDIDDWDFGITTRQRSGKLALEVVKAAFAEVPFPASVAWPRVSVVVCTYNGSATIRQTLEELLKLDYPDFEIIVINDGSRDTTASVIAEFPVRVITTENRGLSAARNRGLQEATGSIVAYTDDDAYPDPHWLQYVAWTLLNSDYAGVGGPNIPPPEDGALAECVANAPGGPVHVLVSAREAEHIPGCNCSFLRDRLLAVGGFDPQFRTAGDDVDLCWRLLENGWRIGFHAGAMVWHHRRGSLRKYWGQQKGYGKAEALLEAKWPSKYNAPGHVTWAGRLYGRGITEAFGRWRIYQGTFGGALFQRLYQPSLSIVAWLPLMPEWYLVLAALGILLLLSVLWPPLRFTGIPLLFAVGAPVLYAVHSTSRATFVHKGVRYQMLTTALHLIQPMARLYGRLYHGLTPWRHRGIRRSVPPVPATLRAWSETWQSPETWIESLEKALQECGAVVRRGGDFDSWDLQIRGCLFASVRTKLGVEDHAAGKQLLRLRTWPVFSRVTLGVTAAFASLALAAAYHQAHAAASVLGALTIVPAVWSWIGCGRAQAALVNSFSSIGGTTCP